jgi:hypothetical protein
MLSPALAEYLRLIERGEQLPVEGLGGQAAENPSGGTQKE